MSIVNVLMIKYKILSHGIVFVKISQLFLVFLDLSAHVFMLIKKELETKGYMFNEVY